MNVAEANEAMLIIESEMKAAQEALARLPGFQSVRISARFKDEDGRKGYDVLLDSDGNLAIQPQSYTPRGERT